MKLVEKKLPKDIMMCELTDAYKETHWMQYPDGTLANYAYLESRGGEYPYTVFFGLQYYLMKYLSGCVVTHEDIDEAIKDCKEVFGFNYFNEKGWRKIADNGGKLPLEIKAVPEGTPVPTKNVLMTVKSTDKDCSFTTGFFEGLFELVWYPCTVATKSRAVKIDINGFAQKAGETVSTVHLNNFGFRGGSSVETGSIGDMAHLVNFAGSDTLHGKRFANNYYDARKSCTTPVLLSVFASEHSTVTSYGEENELFAYREILRRAPPEAIVSMVIDSYDAMRAVDTYIGKEMHDEILARPGKIVLRPDSGDPLWMSVAVLKSLWKNFGGTINDRGYKVLDPHVGVIYGDFISPKMIHDILVNVVIKERFAPSNIIFGMGGELVQKVNRDTQSFAYKCSAIKIGDEWRDVYKRPVSDSRKASKRGILALVERDGQYKTILESEREHFGLEDVLQTVFLNGEIVKKYTFEEVRNNARI